jgi:3-polyprenyl-4-hydroxybenzoate decarboxylase
MRIVDDDDNDRYDEDGADMVAFPPSGVYTSASLVIAPCSIR